MNTRDTTPTVPPPAHETADMALYAQHGFPLWLLVSDSECADSVRRVCKIEKVS